MGSMTEEGDNVVAGDSNSKLWNDVDWKRAVKNWNMKYVDIARSPVSALRVFTSSERLANQTRINEIGEVGKLVKRTEMDAPRIGKFVIQKLGTLEKLKNWCKRSRWVVH